MRTIIWLDDLRNPEKYINTKDNNVIWIHSYKEFVEYFWENNIPDAIWFDHDLGEGGSGYDCAKFLVGYCQEGNLQLPEYQSQSQNPVGRENIISILDNYKKFKNENDKN